VLLSTPLHASSNFTVSVQLANKRGLKKIRVYTVGIPQRLDLLLCGSGEGHSSGLYGGMSVKLTTHLHLVPSYAYTLPVLVACLIN
jgi:hypothetical protein